MKPFSLIREHERNRRALVRLLSHSAAEWRDRLLHEPSKQAAKIVLHWKGQPYMRLGYALRELFVTPARAQELAHSTASLWPSMRKRVEKWRDKFRLDAILPPLEGRALMRRAEYALIGRGNFIEVVWSLDQPDSEGMPSDASDSTLTAYYALCRYRDMQSLATLDSDVQPPCDLKWYREPKINPPAIGLLEPQQHSRLEALTRRFRVSNLLFSWLPLPGGESTFDRYRELFRMQLHREHSTMDPGDFASMFLRGSSLPESEHRNLIGILGRLGAIPGS